MTRKKEVVKRMLRQALTEEAMSKMEKKRQLTHIASDEEGRHVIRNHEELKEVAANGPDLAVPEKDDKGEGSATSTEFHDTAEDMGSKPER
jgi:hypothetical protein